MTKDEEIELLRSGLWEALGYILVDAYPMLTGRLKSLVFNTGNRSQPIYGCPECHKYIGKCPKCHRRLDLQR